MLPRWTLKPAGVGWACSSVDGEFPTTAGTHLATPACPLTRCSLKLARLNWETQPNVFVSWQISSWWTPPPLPSPLAFPPPCNYLASFHLTWARIAEFILTPRRVLVQSIASVCLLLAQLGPLKHEGQPTASTGLDQNGSLYHCCVYSVAALWSLCSIRDSLLLAQAW